MSAPVSHLRPYAVATAVAAVTLIVGVIAAPGTQAATPLPTPSPAPSGATACSDATGGLSVAVQSLQSAQAELSAAAATLTAVRRASMPPALVSAQRSMRSAQWNYQRIVNLYNAGDATVAQVATAVATVNSTQTTFAAAQAAAAKATAAAITTMAASQSKVDSAEGTVAKLQAVWPNAVSQLTSICTG